MRDLSFVRTIALACAATVVVPSIASAKLIEDPQSVSATGVWDTVRSGDAALDQGNYARAIADYESALFSLSEMTEYSGQANTVRRGLADAYLLAFESDANEDHLWRAQELLSEYITELPAGAAEREPATESLKFVEGKLGETTNNRDEGTVPAGGQPSQAVDLQATSSKTGDNSVVPRDQGDEKPRALTARGRSFVLAGAVLSGFGILAVGPLIYGARERSSWEVKGKTGEQTGKTQAELDDITARRNRGYGIAVASGSVVGVGVMSGVTLIALGIFKHKEPVRPQALTVVPMFSRNLRGLSASLQF